jgi:hypothetical protein
MGFLSRTALTMLSAAAVAPSASPDEIYLRGGGRVSGVIVERTESTVSIETAPGRLTLSMKRVLRIVEARSAVEEFQERAAALADHDVAGWAALARWAAERDLVTPSREAWQRVLALDPAHPEANDALGRVQLDGQWMSEGEAYRAQGYVPYEGRWVTPAEHEALVRERAAEEAADLERREADLRVREAEARAREAEARAREAEASANASIPDGSLPIWWGGVGLPLYLPDGGYAGDGYPSTGHPGDGHRGRRGDPDGRPHHPQRPSPPERPGPPPPRTHSPHPPSAVGPASSGPAQPAQVGATGERSSGGSGGRWRQQN